MASSFRHPTRSSAASSTPTAADSKPFWPPTIVPPKGAPNVLLIMTDDQGYGVTSTFGGVFPTPAMDRIAKAGLRYTQFHSTALCSPTRAALITGRNHHSVGFGVISEQSTGYPGYDSIIDKNSATIGQILKGNGYATSWFGKNHNTPTYVYSLAGPYDQWPSGMGFDYFYGFMGGETNQWTPYLFRDHTQIYPWAGKPNYNLTTDMADEAISYMNELNAAAPEKPFFLYYVPGGTHAPHHPTPEWIAKMKGKFDMGWNQLREQIFANQKKLGVIPANTQLTPWPDSLPKWDTLTSHSEEGVRASGGSIRRLRRLHGPRNRPSDPGGRGSRQARQHADHLHQRRQRHQRGRHRDRDDVRPRRDPGHRHARRRPTEVLRRSGFGPDDPAHVGRLVLGLRHALQVDEAGGILLRRHAAGNVHFVAGHIKDVGGIRSQFHHMIDIVPTILEAAGIRAPEIVDGIAQKPIEGVSMAYTFDSANAKTSSKRDTQYFEMFGNRAIYHDGWIAATVPPQPPWLMGTAKMPDVLTGYKWELYNIADDYSENNDLAAKNPARLKELQDLFMVEAKKYQVLPLDNSILERLLTPRPSAVAGRTEFTYTGEIDGLPDGSVPNTLSKSYSVAAEVEIPQGGAEGMLNTLGGRFGGYGLYLLKSKPVFTYNLLGLERFRWEGAQALTPGKHTILFDFAYDGPGMAKGGTGVLSVDGKEVARKTIPHTIPALMTIDETFDVGVDTRTGVDDRDYQSPFRFTGKLNKVTIKLVPPKMTAEEEDLQERTREAARNAAQ